MHVSSQDEFALIARLTRSLASHSDVLLGVGDDCAVLDLNADTLLLATCDSQVEGVHFTLQTASPEEIGRKALAVNLSDIAAMGGTPRFALVSLILPSHFSLPTLDGIYAGLQREAELFSTLIVGGNVSGAGKSAQLAIDITLLGIADRGHVLTRSGAHIGDVLCVTGHPGDSAAGLHTLLHPLASSEPALDAAGETKPPLAYSEPALSTVRTAHRTPHPRVREGQLLAQLGPEIVTSLLDISDGLSGDLVHICERSHVGARVEVAALPFSPSILTIAVEAQYDPLLWTLHGGEDYELLFTVSPAHLQHVRDLIQNTTGTPVTPIGTILPASDGLQLLFPDNHIEPMPVKSWNHLAQ
jgi:thiamine-monophosphate kinase